jgi:hypothetical protein
MVVAIALVGRAPVGRIEHCEKIRQEIDEHGTG